MTRATALALALGGCALALWLTAYTAICGVQETEPSEPGTPQATQTSCASSLHPASLPLLLLSVLAIFAVWTRTKAMALAAGAFALLVGFMFSLSLGWVGLGVAALLIAAGLAAPSSARRPDH